MGPILLGFVSLANILLISSSSPVTGNCNETIYDAIFKECPSVNKSFIDVSILNKCKNWCIIKDTKNLTMDTEKHVLCLMYYESFTSYCRNTNVSLSNATVDLNHYTSSVCNLTSANLNGTLSVFGNDTQKCEKLCYDYDHTVVPLCQWSHFYLNLTMSNKGALIVPINFTTSKPLVKTEKIKSDQISNADITSQKEEKKSPIEVNMGDNEFLKNPLLNVTTERLIKSSTEKINSNVGGGSPVTSKNDVPEMTQADEPDTQGINEPEKEGPNENNVSEIDEEDDPVGMNYDENKPAPKVTEKKEKPETLDGDPASYSNTNEMDGESYFFFYFMVVCVLFVLGYVGYHNRQKVLALVLEGKRGKRSYRRRPNSANYHKLDSNLEEAMSSACTKNSSHVIY